jgi:hypothetical protein
LIVKQGHGDAADNVGRATMCKCLGKKILVVGTALATGGILTGMAAIYFDAVPRLPLATSITVTLAFCLAIVGTMTGFAWLCEKFDDLRVSSVEDFLDDSKRAGAVEIHPSAEAGSTYRTRRGVRSGQSPPLSAGSRPVPASPPSHRTDWTDFGTATVTANGWRGQ